MTTILIIEDSKELANVIKRELEQENYFVLQAFDGNTGIQMACQHSPDCIILDWMLPGKDGLSVLRALGEDRITPVLMLTARSDEADRVIGLEMGADDYLSKPFSMRELLARIHAIMRRNQRIQDFLKNDRSPGQQTIQWNSIVINPIEFRAESEGQDLGLTRTEFDLLYLFVNNPKRVFSRTYLLEAVWGENYIEGDRSVDNAILRLRKKLGENGEMIETVWGMGYKFRGDL
ncbi:MAG: DNA-binding response regulator [Anaerolineaceae bacterium]|nr:DNA-binding response regulator [Anaerolineaceae bacterium]